MAQSTKRATEDSLALLHNLVTEDLIHRIRSGENSTADLRAAIEWLKANSITGVAAPDTPLNSLEELLEGLDFHEVEGYVRGA